MTGLRGTRAIQSLGILASLALLPHLPAQAGTECSGADIHRPVEVIPRASSGLAVVGAHLEGDTLCFRVRNRKVPRYVDIYVDGVRKADGRVVDLGRQGYLNPTQHNALWNIEDVVQLARGDWEAFEDTAYRIRHNLIDLVPPLEEAPFAIDHFSSFREIRVQGYGLGFSGNRELSAEELGRVLEPAILTLAVDFFARLKKTTKTVRDWRPAPAVGASTHLTPIRQFFADLVRPFRKPGKLKELQVRYIQDPQSFARNLQVALFQRIVELGIEKPDLYLDVLGRLGFKKTLDLQAIKTRIGKMGPKKVLRGLEIVEVGTSFWDLLNLYRAHPVTTFKIVPRASTPYVFLIDTSESMKVDHRIEDARQTTLDELRRLAHSPRTAASQPSVAVLSFAGSCALAAITRTVVDFTTDLEKAAEAVPRNLPAPAGRTPLPQAVREAERRLNEYLAWSGGREGRLILLSDGRSTCGPLRPAKVYGYSPVNGQAGDARIHYQTVGFHLEPGSPAERDLQYLASSHGGRYYSAHDRQRLARAFEKALDDPQPKLRPQGEGLTAVEGLFFTEGLLALELEQQEKARALFSEFLKTRPSEPAARYNLALALEATDRFLQAAEHYERYLALAPDAPDRAEVEREIPLLRQDHRDHRAYQVERLRSDLEYLKRYYQSLFHRSSTDLSIEFAGFLREKQELYERLPEQLGVEGPWLEGATEDLATSFERIARRLGTPGFDRDAVSLLTLPIGRLEEIVRRLEE